jgi:hypothetical protein
MTAAAIGRLFREMYRGMNMKFNMILILMSAASLALVACDKPASTTVAQATPTPNPMSTPTPAPITPVVDDKAANWKIIEDMRKGIVQATPTPAPTVIPHLHCPRMILDILIQLLGLLFSNKALEVRILVQHSWSVFGLNEPSGF